MGQRKAVTTANATRYKRASKADRAGSSMSTSSDQRVATSTTRSLQKLDHNRAF